MKLRQPSAVAKSSLDSLQDNDHGFFDVVQGDRHTGRGNLWTEARDQQVLGFSHAGVNWFPTSHCRPLKNGAKCKAALCSFQAAQTSSLREKEAGDVSSMSCPGSRRGAGRCGTTQSSDLTVPRDQRLGFGEAKKGGFVEHGAAAGPQAWAGLHKCRTTLQGLAGSSHCRCLYPRKTAC